MDSRNNGRQKMKVENVFGPIDIAVSGLRAQNKQLEVISSNIANARTTDAGKGEPYRRLEAVFKTQKDEISGVEIGRIEKDMSSFESVLDPGNPKADKNGYVQMPNVSLPVEMINMSLATRTYQANAAVLKRYQQMVETTLELLR
jgi:flagellar basal-body rod protein FlgC